MKIILNSKVVEGIPLIEYYKEDTEYTSLVFVQHGYQSTKEYGSDYLAIDLARNNHFVVAIDAYKHGERIQEPYISGSEQERLDEAFIVVKRTALDIIRLHHNYYKQFKMFDIVGVSLGGMIAYYAATKTAKINHLVPVISTPNFKQQAYHAVGGAGLNTEDYFDQEKLQFIQSIDPVQNQKQLRYQSLHIFCGDQDPVVPMDESKQFFLSLEHTENATFQVYPVDHSVPRIMQKDIITCLQT